MTERRKDGQNNMDFNIDKSLVLSPEEAQRGKGRKLGQEKYTYLKKVGFT